MDPLPAAALLFDLDGTLVDSDAVVERCWRRWAAGAGVDAELLLPTVHGRRAREVIGELFPDRDPELNRRDGEAMLAWEITDSDGVVPVPGARELIGSLDGAAWGIVTSCTRPLAEARLRAARIALPRVMVTAEQVGSGKPDPECYLEGASADGVAPEACIAFEDAAAGIHAALAAGMKVVAVGPRLADPACAAHIPTLEPVRATPTPDGVTVEIG